MDYQAFLEQTQILTQESEDFFVSPDSPGENREAYDRMCAEFGIHRCEDVEQYHALLEELGEDAVNNAYLPEENEGMNLR